MNDPESSTQSASSPVISENAGGDGSAAANGGDVRRSDDIQFAETLEKLRRNVRTAVDSWRSQFDDSRLQMTTFVTTAAEFHAGLLSKTEALAFKNRSDCFQAIEAYRQEVHTQIYRPIVTILRNKPPAFELTNTHLELLGALAAAATLVPKTTRLSEADDLFQSVPSDTFGITVRKTVARMYRTLIRRPTNIRTVPTRSIVDYHLRVRLPLIFSPAHESAQREVALQLSRLERHIANWTSAMLVVEREIDGPDVHHPTVVDWTAFDHQPDERNDTEIEDVELLKTRDYLLETAQTFQQALEKVATASNSVIEVDDALVGQAFEALANDIDRGGTALDVADRRQVIDDQFGPTATAKHQRNVWLTWQNQVADRLSMGSRMLELRRHILLMEDSILDQIAGSTLSPIFDTFVNLGLEFERLKHQAIAAADDAEANGDLRDLRRKMRAIQKRVQVSLKATLRELPGLVAADQELAAPGAAQWKRLRTKVETEPESFTIHALSAEAESEVNPNVVPQSIEFRQLLLESLPALSDRLQPAAMPLRSEISNVWTELEKVSSIVENHVDTAIAELDVIMAGEADSVVDAPDDESRLPDHVRGATRARELAKDGFGRATATMNEIALRLRAPWSHLEEAAVDLIQEQWIAVLRRVRTGDPGAQQWEGWQARFKRYRSQLGRRSREVLTGWLAGLGRVSKKAIRRFQRLYRKGQSAVGVLELADEDLIRAFDTVAEVSEERKKLPLIYRRLFSFEPLAEPALLEGRSRDLAWVRNHYRRWTTVHRGGALILSAPQGGGRTSFLRIVADSALHEVGTGHLVLAHRVTEESELVELLQAELKMEGSSTLKELEHALSERDESGGNTVNVCLIDDLEHLVLRAAGGRDLAERFLLFLSRTDMHVYWVLAIADLAWRYLQTTASSMTSFLTHRELTPIDRNALEAIVVNRHNRTGMAVAFEQQPTQATALRQLLSGKRPNRDRQELNRGQYFDRLYRASGQNIMLALYYWIMTADFDSKPETLTVRAMEPLRFELIDRFELQRSFSLESFLFHKTLSLKEHNRVSRTTDDESTFVMESLLNMRIIQPLVPASDDAPTFSVGRIDPNNRYRINPLLLHPIRKALRQKHIIY